MGIRFIPFHLDDGDYNAAIFGPTLKTHRRRRGQPCRGHGGQFISHRRRAVYSSPSPLGFGHFKGLVFAYDAQSTSPVSKGSRIFSVWSRDLYHMQDPLFELTKYNIYCISTLILLPAFYFFDCIPVMNYDRVTKSW